MKTKYFISLLLALSLPLNAHALTIGENSLSSGSTLTLTGTTAISAVGNTSVTGTLTSSGALTVSAGGADITGNVDATGDYLVNGSSLLPAGTIMMYGAAAAPDGYLLCNGAAVSRTTYADLFAAIGTTFGAGDAATTFNLPDFSNRFPYGGGDLGDTGGTNTVTLTTDELPSHTHTGTTDADGSHTHGITDPGHSHGIRNGRDDGNISNQIGQASPGDANDGLVDGYGTEAATTGISINAGGAHTHDFTTNATGAGEAFSILNPYLSVKFIIKY